MTMIIMANRHHHHRVLARLRIGLFTVTACLLLVVVSPVQSFSTTAPSPSTDRAQQYQANEDNSSSSNNNNNNIIQDLVSGSIAWNSLVGEADRAFCLGIRLEKNGQTRQAASAFHEAATLYQCYLDSPEEFGHVTSLAGSEEDCAKILAYACISLGFLNMDALKNPQAATRLYGLASTIDPVPTAVSFDGMGQSTEAAGGDLQVAIQHYRRALEISQNNNLKVKFHLAVALDRLKETDEDEYGLKANELLDELRRQEAEYSCLVDSWGYVRWHTRKQLPDNVNLYRGTRDMLELALQHAQTFLERYPPDVALICEFGVGSGRSLRLAQELIPLDRTMHGFDTFTGLPQAWGGEPAGAYSTGGIVPTMEGPVVFHKGLFAQTIPPFLQNDVSKDAFLAYANIDCRLYTSTVDILENFHGYVVPGTVFVFNDYIGSPTWRQDEFRAWRECCKRFGWKYEYIGFSLATMQAVVRVTDA